MPISQIYGGPQFKQFSANLNQAAATYDLFTASGNVLIRSVSLYVSVAGSGFTTVAFQTNNTTADILLAALAAASVTALKNLTSLLTVPFVLGDTKKMQYTLVGAGSGGTVVASVEYYGGSLA